MQFSEEAPSFAAPRRSTTPLMSLERLSSTYPSRHFSNTEKQRGPIVDNVTRVAIADAKRGCFVAYREPLHRVSQCCRVEL